MRCVADPGHSNGLSRVGSGLFSTVCGLVDAAPGDGRTPEMPWSVFKIQVGRPRFSLTPALSRWEREKRSQRPGNTPAESCLNADGL